MSQAFEFPVDNLRVQLEHLLIRKAVGIVLFPLTPVKINFVCVWMCVRARASVVMFLVGLIHKLAKVEMLI